MDNGNLGLKEFIENHKIERIELGKIINPILERYTLPDKEKLEVCQIGKFVYKVNSEIKILEKPNPPDPDFIIEFESKKIGLEHTRIFKEESEDFNRISSLVKFSEKLYQTKYPNEKVLASISFVDEKMIFTKAEKHDLAKELVDCIYNLSTGINIPYPAFISRIKISTHSQISFWFKEKNWQAPYLTLSRLKTEIEKKESKIINYKKGNSSISEFWLVLLIGSLSSVSYQYDSTLDYTTESHFDRVYLMNDFEASIIRIK